MNEKNKILIVLNIVTILLVMVLQLQAYYHLIRDSHTMR